MSPCLNRNVMSLRHEMKNAGNPNQTPAKLVEESPFRKFCLNNLSPLFNFQYMSPMFNKEEREQYIVVKNSSLKWLKFRTPSPQILDFNGFQEHSPFKTTNMKRVIQKLDFGQNEEGQKFPRKQSDEEGSHTENQDYEEDGKENLRVHNLSLNPASNNEISSLWVNSVLIKNSNTSKKVGEALYFPNDSYKTPKTQRIESSEKNHKNRGSSFSKTGSNAKDFSDNDIKEIVDSKIKEYQNSNPIKKNVISCNCKRSRCVKLYCECFSAGRTCKDCNCIDCDNTSTNDKERYSTMLNLIEKNSFAFKPKVEGEPIYVF